MYTTLNKLIDSDISYNNYTNLLQQLNKTEPDDEPLHLMTIFTISGIVDAIYALNIFPPEKSKHFLSALAINFDFDLLEYKKYYGAYLLNAIVCRIMSKIDDKPAQTFQSLMITSNLFIEHFGKNYEG